MESLESEARDYLVAKGLDELFFDLGAALIYNKPEDVKSYLVSELKRRSTQGSNHGILVSWYAICVVLLGLLDAEEVTILFKSIDTARDGHITKCEAISALESVCATGHHKNDIAKLVVSERVTEYVSHRSFKRNRFRGEFLALARVVLKLDN